MVNERVAGSAADGRYTLSWCERYRSVCKPTRQHLDVRICFCYDDMNYMDGDGPTMDPAPVYDIYGGGWPLWPAVSSKCL